MYVVSNDQIIHETIDGESMIVNLIDGTYYSTLDTGAFLWQMIINGHRIEDCVAACQKQYQCAPSDSLNDKVDAFVDQLLKEGLILESESNEVIELNEPEVAVEAPEAFTAPVLNKYSDMQDLLLLDPIHDVDESGWPHPKNG